MIAGYASYEARYRRELRTVRASIDSLRALTVGGDSLQTMRLDSITRLIADKERRTVSLRRSIRAGATAGLLDKNIRSLIGPREAVVADTIPFRSIVRQDTTAVPRAKRRFFQRLGDLFSPPEAEPRDLAARDHRPGHPRRRGEGHHRAGAASLAGQRHEQPAGHLRPCVAGGAAVELQQRTGQYEDIPPDHGLRGRGHGLPDAAYRAQRGFPQAVVAHPGRRSHRGRGADAPVRRDALARHQSQQPLPPRAGARQPRQGVAAGGAREADAGHHARHQGPAGIGDGLYRPACAADGRQAAGTLPAQHERVVGTPAGAGQQSAGFLPAGY